MPSGLSDVRATLTLDASGFASGTQQASAALDALDASGARAAQSSASVEARAQGVSTALSSAANQGRSFDQALNSASASAGTAAARVDALAIKTEAARTALAAAQQSAAESAARLQELQTALTIDSSNIAQVQAELEALRNSSSGSSTEIRVLEQTLTELNTDAAVLQGQIDRESQTLQQNGMAAEQAAAKYNLLMAQLRQAQVAADNANARFASLNNTMSTAPGMGAFSQALTSWGTSTLTSASRSMASMVVSASGLATSTEGVALATNSLMSGMGMIMRMAGPWGLAIGGAATLATWGVKKLTEAYNENHDTAGAMQDIIDEAADNNYTAALGDVTVELSDEDGIKSQINTQLQHCFDTLTDGEADTPEVVADLHAQVDAEYDGVRAQVDQYFADAIAGAETEAAKEALIAKQDEILSSLDASEAAAHALIDTYAGQTTEVYQNAINEINAIQAQVDALLADINTAKELMDSRYGDSYAKVAAGYYATPLDIEWSLVYIQAERTNAEAQAREAYETASEAINDAFDGKDGSESLEVTYEVGGVTYTLNGTFDELTKQVESEYQGALDTAQNEMVARWNAMLWGLAESGSMGSEATEAFRSMAAMLDVQAAIDAFGSALENPDWSQIGTEFWEKVAAYTGLDADGLQQSWFEWFGHAI